jgi:PAS domain S-box-containing protein
MVKKPTYEDLDQRVKKLEKEAVKHKLMEQAHRESERLLNDVFNSIQDGISVLSTDLTIRSVNGVMKKWYAKNLPLEGKKCHVCYHDSDKPCDPCPTIRCVESGQTEREIVPGLPGSPVEWIELFSYPMKDLRTGEVTGVVEFVRDITERKQSEEALLESEKKYRTILASVEDSYFEVNQGGEITFFNEAFSEITGYPPDELMGMKNDKYLDKESRKKVFKKFNEVWKTGIPTKLFEYELIRKNGEKRTVQTSASLVTDKNGQKIGFRGIIRDVSDRKLAEEALRKSESMLRGLFLATPVGISVVKDRTFIDINNEFCNIVGYNEKELIGNTTQMLYASEEERRRVGDELYTSLWAKGFTCVETLHLRKDGEIRDIVLRAAPVLPNDASAGAVVAIEDITNRKRAEEELRESKERFKLLAESTIEGLAFHDKGLLLDANDKFVEMFGYDSLTEMLDMKINVDELASPKTREIVRKNAIKEYPEPYEAEGLRKDGSIFPIIIHGRQIPHMGKMVRIAAVRDITEQKKAEQDLRESEEKYRAIFENIQDVYLESSLDGVIIEISPSIESISKYKRNELIGKSVYDLYTNPDERDELIKVVLAKGRVSDLEINLTDKDGLQKLCSINTLLVVDEQRNPLKFVGSMRDITKRKKAEEEKEKLIGELQTALSEVKTLRGILPLCSFCKKIRDDKGYWEQVDIYIHKHSQADISHGICPACAKEHYPDLDIHE